MKLLADPRLVNFILMGLFLANAIRWSIEKKWMDVAYWIGCIVVTIGVTFK